MLKNLLNYVKNKDYLISIFKNKVYIYNYKYIIDIDSDNIKIDLNNKKIKITGKNIVVEKLENKELLIKLECRGIEFYE